jgi:hypothetical protein
VKLDDKITFILWVIELSGLIGLGITIEDVMIIWGYRGHGGEEVEPRMGGEEIRGRCFSRRHGGARMREAEGIFLTTNGHEWGEEEEEFSHGGTEEKGRRGGF